jgi:hypothetical protein
MKKTDVGYWIVIMSRDNGQIIEFLGVYTHLIRAEIIKKWAEHCYPDCCIGMLKNVRMKERDLTQTMKN